MGTGQRSLAEILAGIDPGKVMIDSHGRIRSSDERVAARLEELVGLLRLEAVSAEANGVQCNCGSCGGGIPGGGIPGSGCNPPGSGCTLT